MAKTVLIADDDGGLRQALALRCKQMGLDVIECVNGLQAFQDIGLLRPDLLVLDVGMEGTDGLSLLEHLQKSQNVPMVPAILLTGRSDEETIRHCERLGAHYVRKGQDTWSELKPLVCELLHCDADGKPQSTEAASKSHAQTGRREGRPRVLVIDDDPAISKAIQIRLATYGIEVLRAFNGLQGYWLALREEPDLVITDYDMPEGRANTVIGRMKGHPLTQSTPVIVLTGRQVEGTRDCGLERDLKQIGAKGYLQKPIDWGELLAAVGKYVQMPDLAAMA